MVEQGYLVEQTNSRPFRHPILVKSLEHLSYHPKSLGSQEDNPLHCQFREPSKSKSAFPNKESLLKLLYMGTQNAQKNGAKQSATKIQLYLD